MNETKTRIREQLVEGYPLREHHKGHSCGLRAHQEVCSATATCRVLGAPQDFIFFILFFIRFQVLDGAFSGFFSFWLSPSFHGKKLHKKLCASTRSTDSLSVVAHIWFSRASRNGEKDDFFFHEKHRFALHEANLHLVKTHIYFCKLLEKGKNVKKNCFH